jgi:hypothetical protein
MDLGLRVPGDAFQISTIEAHDAMVKFGSMPQLLVSQQWWLPVASGFKNGAPVDSELQNEPFCQHL